jgi:hypothetical protein
LFPSDDPAATDLQVSELPGTHLVIKQVAGEAGDLGYLIDGVGEPLLQGSPLAVFVTGFSPRSASRRISWL